jgi:hypothetical protein
MGLANVHMPSKSHKAVMLCDRAGFYRYPDAMAGTIYVYFRGARSLKLLTAYSKKEVFQPHLPVRLPCYDLAPVTGFTLDNSLRLSS